MKKIVIGSSYSKGLSATYEGYIKFDELNVSTIEKFLLLWALFRGGSINSMDSVFFTERGRSPLVYSMGSFEGNFNWEEAKNSQCIVVDGNGSVLSNSEEFKFKGIGYKDIDNRGIFLYSSNNKTKGNTSFKCDSSEFEIVPTKKKDIFGREYDDITPSVFSITNTEAHITLENCKFSFNNDIFLTATINNVKWGNEGKNEGKVYLNLIDQKIEGDLLSI